MLREINIHELIQTDDPILVIMGSTVYTAEEFFDDEIRILVDEGAAAAEPEEPEPEPEPESEKQEAEEQKTGKWEVYEPKPKRRGRKSNRAIVEEAFDQGYESAEDIVRLTGLSSDTVRKCIREMEAESYE